VRCRDKVVRDLVLAFLRLGFTAFGGPAAHIAMMEEELVRRRAWVTRQEFLDLVGAAGLIPGPSSTEVAIFLGYRRAGWRGLVAAGVCFILPAALIVTAIAWAYVRYGRLPAAGAALGGVKAVIVAVLAQALIGFARTAITSVRLGVLAALAVGASAYGIAPLAVLVAAGTLSMIARNVRPPGGAASAVFVPAIGVPAALPGAGLGKLFLFFLKIGSVVFGSGYVLLAFLRDDLVERTHWLTEGQLLDAIAVGQFTPGPVFTTATFIGYVVLGVPGAIVATVGIFLPSFALVAVSGPLLPRLRRSPVFRAFLDGVNVASVALMAVVAARLGREAIVDGVTVAIALASAAALYRFRTSSAWLVLAGAIVGTIAQRLTGP
jgi:chromate transporter